MRIIINASTIVKGGAIQVAINLIKFTISDSKHQYFYILNPIVAGEINTSLLEGKICLLAESPANIFSKKIRKKVHEYEAQVRPDIVYSVAAPSYLRFKAPETLRLTNPWILSNERLAYGSYPLVSRLKMFCKVLLQRKFISKNHYIITQTDDAKRKVNKTLGIENSRIFVVPNVLPYNFQRYLSETFKRDYSSTIEVFVLAVPYPHKNLVILIEIAKYFKKKGINNIIFKVTLPASEKESQRIGKLAKENCVESYFRNIGKVKLSDLPIEYEKSHIFFLPTLLEVFSVSFLESMAFQLPIVTTDLTFNKVVCEEAAMYFEPKNYVKAAEFMLEIIRNENLRAQLISAGQNRVKLYSNNSQLYQNHIDCLEEIQKCISL